MQKRKTPRIAAGILLIVLVIAVALCNVPWPAKTDVTMHGAKVTEDGAVPDEGEIVIRGWRLNYLLKADRFAATEMEILDLHFATEVEHRLRHFCCNGVCCPQAFCARIVSSGIDFFYTFFLESQGITALQIERKVL